MILKNEWLVWSVWFWLVNLSLQQADETARLKLATKSHCCFLLSGWGGRPGASRLHWRFLDFFFASEKEDSQQSHGKTHLVAPGDGRIGGQIVTRGWPWSLTQWWIFRKKATHLTSSENSGKVSKIRIKELIIFWVMQQACLEHEHCLRLVSVGFFPGLRWPFGFGDYSCPGTWRSRPHWQCIDRTMATIFSGFCGADVSQW